MTRISGKMRFSVLTNCCWAGKHVVSFSSPGNPGVIMISVWIGGFMGRGTAATGTRGLASEVMFESRSMETATFPTTALSVPSMNADHAGWYADNLSTVPRSGGDSMKAFPGVAVLRNALPTSPLLPPGRVHGTRDCQQYGSITP